MPERIKTILDRWNPIGLEPLSLDEYLPVAEQIADNINEHFTVRFALFCGAPSASTA